MSFIETPENERLISGYGFIIINTSFLSNSTKRVLYEDPTTGRYWEVEIGEYVEEYEYKNKHVKYVKSSKEVFKKQKVMNYYE